MTSTADQMRAWHGPAILTFGFRPFFFGAAVWAAIAMMLWVPMLAGHLTITTAFDPISWHAHEFVFGYLSAVIAGFLLTAVPNWTGRMPIVGWRLGGLAGLWLAGRIAVAISAHLWPLAVALVDLAMPVTLGAVITREIVVGKNWRNLIVLALLSTLAIGNAVFHLEAARGDFAAQGYGLRIGLAAGLMMIAVIGGRIVPSFTRNWLVKRPKGPLPAPPMQRFDKIALITLFIALVLWVIWPEQSFSAVALLFAGGVHAARLSRWAGYRTYAEPLVAVLHVAYGFLPLGAIATGVAILWPHLLSAAAAQHLWMAGAVGLMTLAVMTRATLGHTGQTLTAGPATIGIYAALVISVLARVAAGLWLSASDWLYMIAGLGWILAFGGFALVYGALLLRLPADKRLGR